MNKKTVLVLGGSGFAGKTLLQELLRNQGSYKIFALQHITPLSISENLKVIQGNLFSDGIRAIHEIKPDIIFHLARNNSRSGKAGRLFAALKGYIMNTLLLKALEKQKRPVTVIYLSGSLMYGMGNNHNEDAPLNPISFAREYVLAEKPFLNCLKRSNSIHVMMARVPWLIGYGSWFKSLYHDPIRRENKLICYSPPDQKLMFLSVLDCAKSLIKLAELNKPGIYNLFYRQSVSYIDFISLIRETYGVQSVVPYNLRVLKKKFERAYLEAFTEEITLATKHDNLSDQLSVDLNKNVLRELKEQLSLFSENK